LLDYAVEDKSPCVTAGRTDKDRRARHVTRPTGRRLI